ncbi:MAG: pilus assembly protein [Chloroflexi bacterium]|nr:pilus assembly protein [Chloroflexota bacterium]
MTVRLRKKDNEKGLAAVELALVLPILVMIVLAVLEVGRVLDAWMVATNAAREGARYAAFGETAGTVTSKIDTYLTNGLAGRSDVTPGAITVTGAKGIPGDPVRVVVPLNVRIFTPWLADLGFPDPVLVQGDATMRLQ